MSVTQIREAQRPASIPVERVGTVEQFFAYRDALAGQLAAETCRACKPPLDRPRPDSGLPFAVLIGLPLALALWCAFAALVSLL